jgi:hypothetical protein
VRNRYPEGHAEGGGRRYAAAPQDLVTGFGHRSEKVQDGCDGRNALIAPWRPTRVVEAGAGLPTRPLGTEGGWGRAGVTFAEGVARGARCAGQKRRRQQPTPPYNSRASPVLGVLGCLPPHLRPGPGEFLAYRPERKRGVIHTLGRILLLFPRGTNACYGIALCTYGRLFWAARIPAEACPGMRMHPYRRVKSGRGRKTRAHSRR